MTTKEIAKTVGKSEDAVQRWIKKVLDPKTADVDPQDEDVVNSIKLKAGDKDPHHPADYIREETLLLIKVGLGKNAAGIWLANNAPSMVSAPAIGESIASVVRETLAAMVPVLIEIVRGAISQQQVSAISAPADLAQRDHLRKVVNAHARRSGDHAGAWSELYTQFYYRYHRNIRECAKNRGMDTLDYAENEGIMEDLLSLAVSMYGGTA